MVGPGDSPSDIQTHPETFRSSLMEGVINGLVLWLVALVLPLVPISDVLRGRLTWGAILAAWTIVVASAFDPLFPEARGLSMGGGVLNSIAFLLFYVGIVAVVWMVATIAVKSLAGARELGRS